MVAILLLELSAMKKISNFTFFKQTVSLMKIKLL